MQLVLFYDKAIEKNACLVYDINCKFLATIRPFCDTNISDFKLKTNARMRGI